MRNVNLSNKECLESVRLYECTEKLIQYPNNIGGKNDDCDSLVIYPDLPESDRLAILSHESPASSLCHPDIICFSIIDWDFRYQRPQQIMSQFAAKGHRVFYIKTSEFQITGSTPTFLVRNIKKNVYEIVIGAQRPPDIYGEVIMEDDSEAFLVSLDELRHTYKIEEAISYVMIASWTFIALETRRNWGWKVIYDCMDEWNNFPSIQRPIVEAELHLVRECDLLVATSQRLHDKWKEYHCPIILARNANDYNFYEQNCHPNEILSSIRHPIIGYFGAIADWFDLDLMSYIAKQRPEYTFVLLGGVFAVDISHLECLGNVRLLGQQPYEAMPQYLYHFDTCIIPFKINPITEATDPVKVYEYLCGGKPVVSVALPELKPYQDFIYLADNKEDFLHQLDKALSENQQDLPDRRRAFAKQNTWEKRYEQILSGITQVMSRVSIIIVTYNNLALTKLCLESIIHNTDYLNYEIIVVDNHSSDGTQDYLRLMTDRCANFNIIINSENAGFSKANNQGLKKATGEYLILLNNDTVVPPGWLSRLIRHLRDPRIGLVGPLTNFAGNESRIDVNYITWREMMAFVKEHTWQNDGQISDIRMLAMFCIALRRDVYEIVGPLDEGFGIGMFEDDDYAERVRRKGYEIICAHDVFVHHFGQASFKKLIENNSYNSIFEENKRRYENKHGVRWFPHKNIKSNSYHHVIQFNSARPFIVQSKYLNCTDKKSPIKTEKTLSVAFFSHSSFLAGAERSLLDLIQDLIDKRIYCHVILPNEGPLKNELMKIGASVYIPEGIAPGYQWAIPKPVLNTGGIDQFIKSLALIMAKLIPYLRAIRPDVIFTQTSVIPWGALCSEILSIPHAWSLCEYAEPDFDFYFGFTESMKALYESSDIIFAVSQTVARDAFRNIVQSDDRISVVYRNIRIPGKTEDHTPSPKSSDISQQKIRIGIFGTMYEGKGQEDLVRAGIELLRKGHKIEVHLYGQKTPEYASRLTSLIVNSGFENSFIMGDFLENPYNRMNEMDIIVSCARNEGFGRTLTEAVLLRKPIIYADCGGPKEIFTNGEHGLSYVPQNHLDLAEKIVAVIHDPHKTAKRIEKAREYVLKTFSKENFSGRIETCLWTLKTESRKNAFKSVQNLLSQQIPFEFLTQRLGDSFSLTTSLYEELDKVHQQIAGLNHLLSERDGQIAEINKIIVERNCQVETLNQAVSELGIQMTGLNQVIAERDAAVALVEKMYFSRSWRITRPFRLTARLFRYGITKEVRLKIDQELRALYYKLPFPIPVKKVLKWSYRQFFANPNIPEAIPRHAQAFRCPTIRPVAQQVPVPDYVVWGVIDWHFRHQRPQQLAQTLAAAGRRIFYVSPVFMPAECAGFEIERLDTDGRLFQVTLQTKKVPVIYHTVPNRETISQLRASIGEVLKWADCRQIISLVQHPFWYDIAAVLPNSRVVYDCMDYHEGFGNNSEEILSLERDLLREADLTITTSAWLDENVAPKSSHHALIRNACDFIHFNRKPKTQYRDRQNRPVIGYYGAIAEWFDQSLVEAVARRFPNCLILLVGSDTADAQTNLAHLPNIKFVGEIPYNQLPYYLHGFDVCLLPFKINTLTLATNPVKIYEYLSAGKPVVTVPLPEMKQLGELVKVVDDTEAFLSAISNILDNPEEQTEISNRQKFAEKQTWSHRVRELVTHSENPDLDPPISIIVITHNNLSFTRQCLKSLEEYSDYLSLEIIVVDNASNDGTKEFLSAWVDASPNRKLILNEKNLGFAAANNQGLCVSKGEYLVLLNNDTHVTPGWIRTLLRHLRRDKGIGLIGPVTNNIGNEAKIGIAYTSMDEMLQTSARYTRERIGQNFPIRTAAFFCAMMPRDVYERVGPLDEAFGKGFFEDDDYCRRIEQLGLRIACAEDVFVHHHLSATFDKLEDKERQILFEQNKAIYEAKWGNWEPHTYRS